MGLRKGLQEHVVFWFKQEDEALPPQAGRHFDGHRYGVLSYRSGVGEIEVVRRAHSGGSLPAFKPGTSPYLYEVGLCVPQFAPLWSRGQGQFLLPGLVFCEG